MADPGASEESTFLETVRKRYKDCIEAERDNRDRAREALRFRDLDQWDEQTKSERLTDPEGARPCLVVDKLNQHVNQVVNDERLNRPQIKVRPVEGGDIEVAKIYDGLIRHIQDQSHADIAYDTGFECAVDGGFGYWRVLTEFDDEMSFDQDLKIGRIRNRFAVYLDPQRQEPDGSDAQYGFILYRCTKDEFKREFGTSADEALDAFDNEGREFADWYGDNWVIYAEYFWVEIKRVTICLLSDGKVVEKGKYDEETLAKSGLSVAMRADGSKIERETAIKKVRWRKVTATKILDNGDWAGKWIPIVEVIGTELDIEGRVRRSGMIRPAMDAQRVDNYATSAFVENVALAPRASWVAATGQLEGQEELWRTANRRNISVLQYTPKTIEGLVVPPPQRSQPPGISQGWLSVLEQAEHNVQAAMGRYNATIGAPSNETSGRAINARAREGDIGSFHYSDNLSRSLRHTGRILVDMIPKIYTTKRIARIIGEDGTPGEAIIDPNLSDESGNPIPFAHKPGEDGKMQKVFNLGVGKYDVTVVTGPSFTTRRLESADAMMEISRGNPQFLQSFGDIIFKSQDWPGAEQIAERFQKMLPPGLAEDEDEGEGEKVQTPRGPVSIAEAGQIIAQLEQMAQQANEVLQSKEMQVKAADAAKQQNESAKLDLDRHKEAANQAQMGRELELKEQELAVRQYEAETHRIAADAAAAEKGANISVLEAQAADAMQRVQEAEELRKMQAEVLAKLPESLAGAMRPIADAMSNVAAIHGAPRVLDYGPDGMPMRSRVEMPTGIQ